MPEADDDATTLHAFVTTQPGTAVDAPALVLPPAGYLVGELIGRGGMGEVMAATDTRIGRDVAIKRMRGESADAASVSRFLREARIQARLDHPAIVPVHEVGQDDQGRPFFTMKRLTGVTLHDRLGERGPLQPLLRAFVDVCFAVELAHSRGVIHRDLKPANIMLGDYNDVYVIDWGIARVLADRPNHANQAGDIDTIGEQTEAGGLLGTPGYMAPEQIDGTHVGLPADVYALGAILFEILAGEPLHPRGRPALATTLETPQVSPAARSPDRAIAPELDAACLGALDPTPDSRPTARQLGVSVQAYLDGDRDLAQRRSLAATQLVAARDALASTATNARATAMRRAGRALALDPESREAAQLVTRLMVEPPPELPADLATSLAAEERMAQTARSRRGAIGYASGYVFLLGLPWLAIKSWAWFISLLVVLGLLVGFAFHWARLGRVNLAISMLCNVVLAIVWSRIASPFMLTPVVVCGVAIAISANPQLLQRRGVFVAFVVVATLLPVALEAFGLLSNTWGIDPASHMFVIRSAIFGSTGATGAVMLLLANTAFVVVVGLYAIDTNRTAYTAKREMQIQAWHLQQLLPARSPS